MPHPNAQACDAIAAACARLRVTHHALTARLALRLLTPPDAVAKMSRLAIARQPEMIPHRHAFWRGVAELLGLPMSALGPPGWVSHIPPLPFIATPEPEPAPPPPPPTKPRLEPLPPKRVIVRAHGGKPHPDLGWVNEPNYGAHCASLMLRAIMREQRITPCDLGVACSVAAKWLTPRACKSLIYRVRRHVAQSHEIWRVISHVLNVPLSVFSYDRAWIDSIAPLSGNLTPGTYRHITHRASLDVCGNDPTPAHRSPLRGHMVACARRAAVALNSIMSARGLSVLAVARLAATHDPDKTRRTSQRVQLISRAHRPDSARAYSAAWSMAANALGVPLSDLCPSQIWLDLQDSAP